LPGSVESIQAFWTRLEEGLYAYGVKYSIPVWIGLSNREGFYVSGATVLLFLLTCAAVAMPAAVGVFAALLAAYYLADSLLYNTRIVFIPRHAASRFRTVVLTINAYLNLGLVFAVFYAVQSRGFAPPVSAFDSVYFSIATMTTIGSDVMKPATRMFQTTIMIELIVSLYFLVVILAAVISRVPQPPDSMSRYYKGKPQE
jgi:hypothetical protein